jgi:adenylate cyclase
VTVTTYALRVRRGVLLVLVGLASAGLGLAGSSTHVLRRPELATVDARFSIRGAQALPRDVVVVGLDAQSLTALNARPPIPRRYHARMIGLLSRAGARVIAYDLQFNAPSPDPRDDNALFRALQRTRGVVLATTIVGPRGQTSGNLAAANLGRLPVVAGSTNFHTVAGEIARLPHDERGLPSFAVAAAQKFLDGPVSFGRPRWIDYAGPAGTVREYSFSDVLRGRVPASTFRGKAVVVGAVDPIFQDVHATPAGDGMPGPEVNANAIATVLRGFPLDDPAGWVALLLIAGAGLAVPLAALRLTGLRWLPVAVALIAAYLVAAQLAFDHGAVLPVAAPLIGLVLATFGTLAVAYATDLRDRRRLRAAFARFVPPSVVDELVERADGARLGAVEREASVLFCDLRGFTGLAERLPAAEVIELLNRYLTAMSDAILDAGGTVVAYMGDGIMAVFGAPLPQPDHADRALRAARDMLGPRLTSLNEGRAEPLHVGIGICTGNVLSGNVGSERRLEYAAVGDTTNAAARLQAMTKEQDCPILISDATRSALHDEPADLREVGELEVRGRSESLRAWTLA